ncbi:MAG: GDP-L-fucose synthase [Deltaproteobacteria bacterium]|nr:MAG: GDP-L-fucose synthase [Deltaproteobacteria bacterium]
MKKEDRIYVAGHRGLVGSAILRKLKNEGYDNLLIRAHKELDLTHQESVEKFFERERIDHVFVAAARVGGILANNTYPAQFIYENLMIQSNIIHAAYRNGVKRLLFLGSSCIYPKACPQPMREEHLLSGPLEPTNEPYAVAKIAGIKMCQSYNRQYGCSYACLMPTNLYGPNDNFDPETSHVLPALIRRFHEARTERKPRVEIWGTGTPRRELMHVDDLADACLFVMNLSDRVYEELKDPLGLILLNVGTGKDLPIRELAETVARIVGFEGEIGYDTTKPDGMPLKCLDVSRMQGLGWRARIDLETGIRETYQWYLENLAEIP